MEIWDLYNKDRIITGETCSRGDKIKEGMYRLVIHVCIFNSKGEMLVQQRQPFKSGWSNMWDVTVGGHSISGESSQESAMREVFEEIGKKIDLSNKRPVLTINFDTGFDDMYIINEDVNIETLKLQPEEVQKVKWASQDEIIKMLEEGVFIPYNKGYIELLFHLRNHMDTRTAIDKTKPVKS